MCPAGLLWEANLLRSPQPWGKLHVDYGGGSQANSHQQLADDNCLWDFCLLSPSAAWPGEIEGYCYWVENSNSFSLFLIATLAIIWARMKLSAMVVKCRFGCGHCRRRTVRELCNNLLIYLHSFYSF
jgi:hypothetical protein